MQETDSPIKPLVVPGELPTSGPLVSVLIPSYNYVQYLGKCINSAVNQTYNDIEIIIVDDRSTEDTLTVIEEASRGDVRVQVHINESNLGAKENFRRCFEYASGTYIKYLLADDLLEPQAISRMVACFENNPGLSLVTSFRQTIDEEGMIIPPTSSTQCLSDKNIIINGKFAGDRLLGYLVNYIGEPTTTMFRTEDAGSPSDFFKLGDGEPEGLYDILIWLRLLLVGDLAYMIEPLSSFRMHPQQRTSGIAFVAHLINQWPQIIRLAKSVGYLESTRLEQSALTRFVHNTLNLIIENPEMAAEDRELLLKSCYESLGEVTDILEPSWS